MERIFCVSNMRFPDTPQAGCAESATCYTCPLAHVMDRKRHLHRYIDLSATRQAAVRQIKIEEMRP